MRIQILSDVHAEFHQDHGLSFLDALDPTDVDVLVVAGDLGIDQSLLTMIDGLADLYPQVVLWGETMSYTGRTQVG